MDINQRHSDPSSRRTGTRRRKNKIVMILVIAFIILFIAKREIPLVSDTINQIIAPEQTKASKTCHHQAMQLGQNPSFARIVQSGQVTQTQQGFLVDQILVGEMGNDGHEATFKVTCYTDSGGQLVRAEIILENQKIK